MKRLLFILLFLPLLSTGQTTFIVNSYQVQAAGGGGYDVDAQTYFTALTTAGVTPTSQQMTDINTFVVDKKAASLWTGFTIYFPVWSNASADAINMCNPGTYSLTFMNSPSHTSSGVDWNGSSQYAKTGLFPSAMAQNSISGSYYSQENTATLASTMFGCEDAGAVSFQLRLPSTSTTLMRARSNFTSATATTITNLATNAYYIWTRTASNDSRLFRNATQLGATVTTASTTPNSVEIYLGAYNANGSTVDYNPRKMSYASFGPGLSGAQVATDNTIVEALHDAFGIGQQ